MNVISLPLTQVSSRTQAAYPLRITRVKDQTTTQACAGLMVISGRMADVCAELDRLVRQEQMREIQYQMA